jgi:hypothetical protein
MKDLQVKQIRVEKTDLEILAKLGEKEERSVTYLIRMAIKDYIKKVGGEIPTTTQQPNCSSEEDSMPF